MLLSALDDLQAQITANPNAQAAAEHFINGIAYQLSESSNDAAKVQAIANQLKLSANSLAAAIVANTPHPTARAVEPITQVAATPSVTPPPGTSPNTPGPRPGPIVSTNLPTDQSTNPAPTLSTPSSPLTESVDPVSGARITTAHPDHRAEADPFSPTASKASPSTAPGKSTSKT